MMKGDGAAAASSDSIFKRYSVSSGVMVKNSLLHHKYRRILRKNSADGESLSIVLKFTVDNVPAPEQGFRCESVNEAAAGIVLFQHRSVKKQI